MGGMMKSSQKRQKRSTLFNSQDMTGLWVGFLALLCFRHGLTPCTYIPRLEGLVPLSKLQGPIWQIFYRHQWKFEQSVLFMSQFFLMYVPESSGPSTILPSMSIWSWISYWQEGTRTSDLTPVEGGVDGGLETRLLGVVHQNDGANSKICSLLGPLEKGVTAWWDRKGPVAHWFILVPPGKQELCLQTHRQICIWGVCTSKFTNPRG